MRDLTNPLVIKLKGGLFLLLGSACVALILAERPTASVAALLAISIWCFCRCYYFAFYVLERYVDPSFRFSGLLSVAAYLLRRQRGATAVRD